VPDDLSLFGDDGDDGDESPTQAVAAPSSVADWQVDLLRKALDSQGLTGMTERRSAVENAVGRQVESLRQLSSEEALSALSKLGGSSGASGATTSAWDDREEDTWIDRL
jgi:hypothetical protein